LPIIYARPPAKNAPTIHENTIGNPKPPRKPVVAGLTASIDSIAGSETSLKIIKPTKIIDPIPIFPLFDFGKFFKT
jgi:hypothetical protein